MPASQTAASERRTEKMITHELPKLKTPLKTPPKQATNPLQFVKVGPCPLYRTAQEQLQKVEEVKKIKQEVREDPEDWQSNLDNWKSSRRKRQEHIIERVVESKKLELEEHDRQRRRSKTFSEMMEERGTRGRKMSVGLAVYLEEDSNDLSDLGIGTSSGKSSVSGDTHEDSHSVLSDRDSEIEKNHSDVDQMSIENGNGHQTKSTFDNGFHKRIDHGSRHNQEYDSATTATASSPEPEEYTYEGAIRGYVSRVAQNIPRRSLVGTDGKGAVEVAKDTKRDSSEEKVPVVKVDIVKRREIFEKAAQQASEMKNHRSSNDSGASKSIKERLSSLERQRSESDNLERSNKNLNRLSGDMSSIRERLTNLERKTTEREMKNAKKTEELESVRPLRERLSNLEKYSSNEDQHRSHGAINAKERPSIAPKELADKRTMGKRTDLCCVDNETRIETSTPSERSSSPDSEYRAPRAAFHRSLDSLDADASSGPDTFERVQSLEELDYGRRRYPASSSSAELLNDTDREDSGIHTADVSCSVSQADEPVDEEIIARGETAGSSGPSPRLVGALGFTSASGLGASSAFTAPPAFSGSSGFSRGEEIIIQEKEKETGSLRNEISVCDAKPTVREEVNRPVLTVATEKETAETSHGELHTNKRCPGSPLETTNTPRPRQPPPLLPKPMNRRPIVYQSPRVPPRKSPPDSNKSSPTSPTSLSQPDFASRSACESSEIDTAPETRSSEDMKIIDAQNPIEEITGRRLAGEEIESHEHVTREDAARVCQETETQASEEISSPDNPYATDFSTPKDVSPSIPVSPTLPELPDTSPPATLPPRIATIDTSHTISPQDPTNLPQDATRSSEDKENHDSPSSQQDTTSPQITAPRSVSRIPMPLPRKSVTKAPSSTGGQQPPVKSRSSQPRKSSDPTSLVEEVDKASDNCETPNKSQIPVPLSSSITNAPQPMVSAAHDKRHTVVEVCEKLTVPRGETLQAPLVTPFITIVRTGEADDSEENIAASDVDLEPETTAKTSLESSPIEPASSRVDEKPFVVESTLIQTIQPRSFAETIQPNRPSTLTIDQIPLTSEEMEILSPLSPMSKQILTLDLSTDEEIVSGLAFPLGPPTSVEPPKEKPPPPPPDFSDEENTPVEPLKRLNSTRRIKKELRTRRSDFLGIEKGNDDDLEQELSIAKPPDMATLLAEERRVEQLNRRSYDTDSNYEQDSSHERDSGVELGHAEDWTKQTVSPDMSQHSRQSSEPFGASVTSSEEDEITKKEREIIEVLEKEEQWRYGNSGEDNSDIGEKLAHKLRELEEEKMQLERERAQEVELTREETTLRKNEENHRKQEEAAARQRGAELAQAEKERRDAEARRAEERMRMEAEIEEERRQEETRLRTRENHEKNPPFDAGLTRHDDEYGSGEVLRVERELLQLEQEELKRQRTNLAYREQKQLQLAEQLEEQWKSMQDAAQAPVTGISQFKALPPPNYRSSMPNLRDNQRRKLPPPPIPPAKPLRLVEQRQRDVMIRSSRMPSADSIPQQVDASMRHGVSATTLSNHAGQQMTRQTLQALSAAPRPRIVQGDQWVQRRKSDVPRSGQDFNYQHWLIQEAEQRRINEQNQRSPRKVQSHITGTSVPYVASPPRNDSGNKPLPDSIIQTLTQRVQNRAQEKPLPIRRRLEHGSSHEQLSVQRQIQHSQSQPQLHQQQQQQKVQQQPTIANNNNNNHNNNNNNADSQEKMLSVSGKKKCSHCGDELGRGAAMIIESLRLFYHMECFKCCVCHVRLGDGRMGTDVRVRNHKLHCHNCYSSDDGVKFSCV